MRRKKRWSEMSRPQRAAVLAMSAVELTLTTVALVDLARRPSRQVRGPKKWWAIGCLVQPLGPIAYLSFGRR